MNRGYCRASLMIALMCALGACTHATLVKQTPPAQGGVLIRDVSVFTAVPGSDVLKDMDVYIKDGVIASLSRERLTISGAEIMDGRGKTLLPGLIDFHTHICSSMIVPWSTVIPTMRFNMEGCLYSGVTTILDMNGEPLKAMKAYASDLEKGAMTGPRLISSGQGYTGKGAHPIPMVEKMKETLPWIFRPLFPKIVHEVDSVNDMEALEEHLSGGPDFTKIFLDDLPDGTTKMNPEIVKEIVRRSHARGIPVLIHIGRNEDVRVAIDSGADGIAHNVYKEPLDPGIARELAEKNMFVIPTVYVFHNLNLFVNEKDYAHYTALEWETMHPRGKKAIQEPKPYIVAEDDPWGQYYRHFRETYARVLHPNVKVLKDAGVTIVAGTDAPNLGMAAGGSLHVELQHLVQAGLTPTEALMAATSTPARVLKEVFHKDVLFGTIEQGTSADLLLVDGDPTRDIRDTQNIRAVFSRGHMVQRVRE